LAGVGWRLIGAGGFGDGDGVAGELDGVADALLEVNEK
jgi:hypothetical protein